MDFALDLDYSFVLASLTAFGLKTIGVVALLVVAWIASKWARHRVETSLGKTTFDVTLTKFFSNMAAWTILLLSVLVALTLFGLEVTSFAAVIGAAGLAIGLAFQGTLSNFAAGVMLLTFRPFKVGDAVKVAGETGKIDEIDLFMTKMDTFDNRRIVIPNSKIFGSVIETITYHPTRRVDVPVGTSYDADLDLTRAALERATELEGRLEEPAPQVWLDGFGDSSINWVVRVWVNTSDFGTMKQALIHAVKRELDAAEIGIPYPQMDVHMNGQLERERTSA